jgi:membrane protein implicated in regulation of membrane protease activity
MANSTIWWLIAGGVVVLELTLGTIYLLLLSAGFASAALAAHAGVGLAGQLITAAVVGIGAVLVWHRVRPGRIRNLPTEANPDMNLDIGGSVQVDAWNADGTATVRYRGAQWTVMPRAGALPLPGAHRVVEVVGSRLVVDKI